MINYAKFVKEMHWPEASIKKRIELEELKSQMKHPIKSPRMPNTTSNKFIRSSVES